MVVFCQVFTFIYVLFLGFSDSEGPVISLLGRFLSVPLYHLSFFPFLLIRYANLLRTVPGPEVQLVAS